MIRNLYEILSEAESAEIDITSFRLMGVIEHGFTTQAEDLIKKGANVNAFNKRTGDTLLGLASKYGRTEIACLLIRYGAIIDVDDINYTSLQCAAINGHTETAAVLIDKGADLNKTGHSHLSALQLASRNGHNNTVKMLIQKGANVNHIPVKGFKPALMLAARMGHTDVAETLIEGGANIDYQDTQDLSALETALMWGKTDIAKLPIEKGANIDGALMQAFKMNNTEVVDILLNKQVDVKHKDKYGKTRLIIAATYGQTELMNDLIDKGSNIEEKDNEGMTALMCASSSGCLKAVEMLIEKEAHVNEKSNDGRASFSPASSNGSKDVFEKLNENVAYINKRSSNICIPGWVYRYHYTSNRLRCRFKYEDNGWRYCANFSD